MALNRMFLVWVCWIGWLALGGTAWAVPEVPDDTVRAFIKQTLPEPSLMAYMPKETEGQGAWRVAYDRGLAELQNGQFLAAALHFSRADKELPENAKEGDARALCRFAAGSSYLLARDNDKAIHYLRRAIGALTQQYKGSDFDPYVSTGVGDSGLHTYHIWHNLIAAYLQAGPALFQGKDSPWNHRDEDKHNEVWRSSKTARRDTPHTLLLNQQQQPGSAAGDLVFANSNLERIYQDPSNLSNSVLLRYLSGRVLLALTDTEGGLRVLEALSVAVPEDASQERLPVRELVSPTTLNTVAKENLNAAALAEKILADTFYWAVWFGDKVLAETLAGKLTADKERAERVLLAVNAIAWIKKSRQPLIGNDTAKQGEELMTKVLAEPQLASLHPEAKQALGRFRPIMPRADDVGAWFKRYGGLLVALAVLLGGLVWVALCWRSWNNNVYYWRMLNYCSREPDILEHDYDDAGQSGRVNKPDKE